MNFLHYCLIVFAITMSSCTRHSYYAVDAKVDMRNGNIEDTLKGQVVIQNLASIDNILCTDQYLIIVQEANDSIFKIIDTKNDSVIACFGHVGHANNEFSQIPLFYYLAKGNNGKDYLCVQEENHTKIIDVESSIHEGKCVLNRIIKEEYSPLFYRIFHLSENKTFIDKLISYQDARDPIMEKPTHSLYYSNDILKKWEIFPDLIETDNPNVLSMEYIDRMYFKPDGTKAVSIMDMVDIMTLFDFDTYKTIGINNIDGYSFDSMSANINSENIMDSLIIYNMHACTTDECFYVLKDGRHYKEMLNNESDDSFFSQLKVYSWDGCMLYGLLLNKALWGISYSKRANSLYGLGQNRDVIYKYRLK